MLGKNSGIDLGKFVEERQRLIRINNIKDQAEVEKIDLVK